MIKTCTSRSKRRIPFQTQLQRKLILLSFFALGAMFNTFHNLSFLLLQDVRTFRLNENISVSGLSSEALQEVCGALVECGTNYSRLRDFSESPTHASAISRAFCSAVWKYLQHYCGFVLSLPRITSVLQLNFTVQPVAAQIR